MTAALELKSASDDDLVRLAQGGNGVAFGQLLERHYDFVYRIAYRWAGRKADAEDIAQDVCVRIGRAIQTYRAAGAFTTWLYALTLNASRDLKRKALRDEAKSEAFRAHALSSAAVEEAPGTPDPADELWHAVRQLPDKQREAVLLVYGEGLSHARAAEMMAISETTVSWHVHEAKKRLRVLMRETGEV